MSLNVLPSGRRLGRPSPGLAACTAATLVPTVWLLWPQPSAAPSTAADIVLGCTFLIPQVLALLLSALQHPVGQALTVVFASIGLLLSLVAVPLYLVGLPFLPQALVATLVAARRAG